MHTAHSQAGYVEGEITLAGFCFSLEDWEALAQEDRDLLIEVALAGEDNAMLVPPVTRMPAMVDLLVSAAR